MVEGPTRSTPSQRGRSLVEVILEEVCGEGGRTPCGVEDTRRSCVVLVKVRHRVGFKKAPILGTRSGRLVRRVGRSRDFVLQDAKKLNRFGAQAAKCQSRSEFRARSRRSALVIGHDAPILGR